jgi:hypothetical protein
VSRYHTIGFHVGFLGAETDEISANNKLPARRDFYAMKDTQLVRALVQDPSRLYSAAVCGGQIEGTANTLQVMGQICEPYGVTPGQVGAVVMNYMARIPERHHEKFTALTVEALKRAWPCHH